MSVIHLQGDVEGFIGFVGLQRSSRLPLAFRGGHNTVVGVCSRSCGCIDLETERGAHVSRVSVAELGARLDVGGASASRRVPQDVEQQRDSGQGHLLPVRLRTGGHDEPPHRLTAERLDVVVVPVVVEGDADGLQRVVVVEQEGGVLRREDV